MLNVSPDLIALARSQIVILTQTLGAVSSAMYVAEEISSDRQNPHVPNLIEVATYPDAVSYRDYGFNPFLMLPASREDGGEAIVQQGRIVVPLIYQDGIMGFLMTGREDRDWTDQEQIQIQQVANTLAIACALDRRCQWLGERIQDVQSDAYLHQQDFIASLLHQLRNPLTAIKTFGQLLLRRVLAEDPNHQLVAGIIRETRHLQDLLIKTDVLSLPASSKLFPEAVANVVTKPILLAPALEIGAVNVIEILENLVIASAAIAQEKHLKFKSFIPQLLPPVWGNALAIREVLNNLIDNAIKYTPELGAIEVRASFNQKCVEIKISDTGVGIPELDLEHLFERNFRGRQSDGNILGTGLGLAIARDLVEKMGGEIGVESTVNLGTCFRVLLKLSSEVVL
jgi:signal transduction histidine kinase